MKVGDMLELAARNLRESLLRSSLTTLGVAVGVASLVAMLSLGVGLQNLAGDRVQGSGLLDTIGVYSRRDISSFDRAERRANPRDEAARPLDESARREMEQLPGVVEVFPEIRFDTTIGYDGQSFFTRVAGLPLSARENEAFETLNGQFFSGSQAAEAILELDFAQRLTDVPEQLIGKDITLGYVERRPLNQSAGDDGQGGDWGFSIVRRQRPFRVVGIIEQEPFGGWRNFARGSVFIPNALAEEMNTLQPSALRDAVRAEERSTYPSLIVRVRGVADVEPVQRAIREMGFTAWSILDAASRLRQFFIIVDLFLGIFGSLALAVASLGVVNTLVMAILERRREIGILKALGASDRDVRRLFFTEAGAMGFLGGIFGVTMGWAIGKAINLGTNFYLRQQSLPPETIVGVPWWLVAGAVGFAVLVSLVSGLYPAARAAKLDPVQALRYE